MQRFYPERDRGPEFDDRLIQLVRVNPAIYDVNHPHYRRNPIRIAIWDNIATELQSPSKFLQTKWKNIRYNYLQEIKCAETGVVNTNIRKRRFTEDLSFLQNTAQSYNVKKGAGGGSGVIQSNSFVKNSSLNGYSDNDSNSYMYPDPPQTSDAFEVIEIEHSDDDNDADDYFDPDFEDDMKPEQKTNEDDLKLLDHLATDATDTETRCSVSKEPTPIVTIERKSRSSSKEHKATPPETSPTHSLHSNRSSPLLTPLVKIGNGHAATSTGSALMDNGLSTDVSKPIHQQQQQQQQRVHVPPSEIMANAAKRKAKATPLPVLTPINDPIELYCLSLVDSLRNMPRSERERVKYEFANILKDAVYKDQS